MCALPPWGAAVSGVGRPRAHRPVSGTVPQQTEGFRKRWFTLDDRRLMYFKDPLVGGAPAPWDRGWGLLGGRGPVGSACARLCPPQDAFARGEVFIGSRESGYTVLDRLPPSTQGHRWPHGITIVTPERRFLLACETGAEQRAWLDTFRQVVDRPMLPQEYAGEAGGAGLLPPAHLTCAGLC